MNWLWMVLGILAVVWLVCVALGWIYTEFIHPSKVKRDVAEIRRRAIAAGELKDWTEEEKLEMKLKEEEDKVKMETDPWYWEKKSQEDKH